MTTSTNLTDSQEVNFTQKEICAILRECRGLANVEIRVGNFELKYHPQGPGDASYQSQVEGIAASGKRSSSELPPEWRHQANLMDEQALQEAEQAQAIIESPFDFEQAQIDLHVERQRMNGDGT